MSQDPSVTLPREYWEDLDKAISHLYSFGHVTNDIERIRKAIKSQLNPKQ